MKTEKMKAYKVFNSDWTCIGFEYKVGDEYSISEKPIMCERGFHACKKVSDCFSYYSFDPKNKVALVELSGIILGDDEEKQCAQKIKIIKEISWNEMLLLANTGHGTVTQGTETQGTVTQGTETQGTVTQGTVTQGTVTQGTETQGTETQGTETQGTETQGTVTQGTETQGTVTQGTVTQGTVTQGTVTQGTVTQGTLTQGTVTQGISTLRLLNLLTVLMSHAKE